METKFDDDFLERPIKENKYTIVKDTSKLAFDLNDININSLDEHCLTEYKNFEDCKNIKKAINRDMDFSLDRKKEICEKIEIILIECLKRSGKAIIK